MAVANGRLVLAAFAGIALAIFLIVRGRVHAFVALLCGAFVIGPLGGLSALETAKAYAEISAGGIRRDESKTVTVISSHVEYESPLRHCAHVDCPGHADYILPGDTVTVEVELKKPVAMDDQLRFAIREGGRTVGSGVVTKIIE